MYKTLTAPVTVQVELTTACNLNCVYCYNYWRHDTDSIKTNLSWDHLKQLVDQLVESGVFHVTFTGGEPLLRHQYLHEAINILAHNGIQTSLNSNLTLLSDATALNLKSAGLGSILTSITSFNPSKHDKIVGKSGSFNDVVRGIGTAKKAGIPIAASMVVIKDNFKDVLDTALFLRDIGISYFYATKASIPINAVDFENKMLSEEEFILVLDELNVLKESYGVNVGVLECYPLCFYKDASKYSFLSGIKCSAGITTCTIGSNGDVRPCSHSDKSYGNVFDKGLKESWLLMKDQRDGSILPTQCKKCDYFSRCSGGCRVSAKVINKSRNSLDPYAKIEHVQEIKISTINKQSLPIDSILFVRNDLKTRKEDFGVLCATPEKITNPVILTNNTFNLLQELYEIEFDVAHVAQKYSMEISAAQSLCAMLLRDGVLKQKSGGVPIEEA